MTDKYPPVHTVVEESNTADTWPITLLVNLDDKENILQPLGCVIDGHLTPGLMYKCGFKCVEKAGDIWTWVYKPASSTPPAKRGRPKKTE